MLLLLLLLWLLVLGRHWHLILMLLLLWLICRLKALSLGLIIILLTWLLIIVVTIGRLIVVILPVLITSLIVVTSLIVTTLVILRILLGLWNLRNILIHILVLLRNRLLTSRNKCCCLSIKAWLELKSIRIECLGLPLVLMDWLGLLLHRESRIILPKRVIPRVGLGC